MTSRPALDNTQAMFHLADKPLTEKQFSIRRFRHDLRGEAARLMSGERVATCGKKPLVGSGVVLAIGQGGGAYFAGLETCGSVWHCPCCAAKVAEGRRAEIEEVLTAHVAAGGQAYMMTLTVPHKFGYASARALRGGVAAAWRKTIQGKAWVEAKGRYRVTGTIRALEVTHGRNGWHPHIHVLVLVKGVVGAEADEFGEWFFMRWKNAVRSLGLGECSRRAFSFVLAERVAVAGDYIGKWGVDSEIAKANTKIAGMGGRSPWQLLAASREGDIEAAMLFREYARAFKGAKQLTWSKGLRALYIKAPELSDYDLAKLESPASGDAEIGIFRPVVWWRLMRAGVLPDVLEAAECGGWQAVLAFLREQRLALPALEPDGG